MADVSVTGSVEKMRAIAGHRGIALLETGGVVEVMAVGVGQGVINRSQARVFGLPRQAGFEGIIVCLGYVLELREGGVADDIQVVCAVAAATI